MFSEILRDALLFGSTPDLAATLLVSRRFHAVAEVIVRRRTLRAVWVRQVGIGLIEVKVVANAPAGSTWLLTETLSEKDDVAAKLSPLLRGRIIGMFALHCDVLRLTRYDKGYVKWFANSLCSVLDDVIVTQTLRLHLYPNVQLESIYNTVACFRYVNVGEPYGF
ncbi:hypothetical protein AAVH_22977 [Aphelenchoides avenae]|nr:hypothetical protein AAVH_22977 [Aphelenchus avenae]